ncbi:PAP/OAS1 substrate-binding domain-containing protein [Viridothelium virens]|uniref:polynucleotide adenylyltransferase n=1 Tax=Viridothelium virens TaxID=1048519 RepID=A0A6A6H0K2_VIRVR|nr:PAP/OAS1 substrate-binding domain-containing protein [Viridothelium virens]
MRGSQAPRVPQILQRQLHQQQHFPARTPHIPSGRSQGPSNPSRSSNSSTFHPLQGPPTPEAYLTQCSYLDRVAREQIPPNLMTEEEDEKRRGFIATLAGLCERVSGSKDHDDRPQATLKAFGSYASGFGTKDSDVDLAVVAIEEGGMLPEISLYLHENDLPRQLEKLLLESGIGARLLTRTRIPILRVCEKPTPDLLAGLRAERETWDALPNEQKYSRHNEADTEPVKGEEVPNRYTNMGPGLSQAFHSLTLNPPVAANSASAESATSRENQMLPSSAQSERKQPEKRPWLRERKLSPLDIPKSGVGITADINFSNTLVMQNTHLLRCYCLCDERVRLMVLFIKAWVGRRKINSAYSGTLSSYGYVLMVLHFLVNIAKPSVVPNLQTAWYLQSDDKKAATHHSELWLKHYDIRFFRDTDEIRRLASQGRLTQNVDPLPVLLRNFFHYYAKQGAGVPEGGFLWRSEVLSLRTPGGLLTKEEKEWTFATTEIVNDRVVRQRYLFAIEDPFEVEHNVARVVTHNGLVAIRDEFRRAWDILESVGRGRSDHSGLFDEVVEPEWEGR